MDDWMDKFLEALEDNGLEAYLARKYVDDVNLIIEDPEPSRHGAEGPAGGTRGPHRPRPEPGTRTHARTMTGPLIHSHTHPTPTPTSTCLDLRMDPGTALDPPPAPGRVQEGEGIIWSPTHPTHNPAPPPTPTRIWGCN